MKVQKSDIHGKGLFTMIYRKPGDIIGLVVRKNDMGIETNITSLGLWVNHSELSPNTDLVESSKGWLLRAIKNIESETELTANYKMAPKFIKRPEDYGGNFKP